MPLVALIVPPLFAFRSKHQVNRERIEDAIARFRHEQEREAFQKAFEDTVKEYSFCLPSHLVTFVAPHGGTFVMATYLGTNATGRSFYHIRDEFFFTDEPLVEDKVPILRDIHIPSLEESEEIALLMEPLRTEPQQRQHRIPPGHFVFTFTAQWAVGGEEDDEQNETLVIHSDSIEHALEELLNVFHGRHENCFSSIFMRVGDGFFQVKAKHPSHGNRELYGIYTRLNEPYRLFV